MMFGQINNREGLRDLIAAIEVHQGKLYHLGLGREPIAKTTLATANQTRDFRIFEDFAFYMMKEVSENALLPLCLITFPWIQFRSKKGESKLMSSMT